MPSPQDYRRRAHQYLKIARTCLDQDIADGFRALAANYFDLADQFGESGPVIQQQQQIEPDEGAT